MSMEKEKMQTNANIFQGEAFSSSFIFMTRARLFAADLHRTEILKTVH
jgi:hypothetical protein